MCINGPVVGINRINTVMCCSDIQNIMRTPTDVDVWQIKRLRDDVTIDDHRKKFSKLRTVDVAGGEYCFLGVLPGAQIVVVMGRYAHLRVDGENTERAQHPERMDESPNDCPHTLGPHIRRAMVSPGRFLPRQIFEFHTERRIQSSSGSWQRIARRCDLNRGSK